MKMTGTCPKCGRHHCWTWKDLSEDKGKSRDLTRNLPCPACGAPTEMTSKGWAA